MLSAAAAVERVFLEERLLCVSKKERRLFARLPSLCLGVW